MAGRVFRVLPFLFVLSCQPTQMRLQPSIERQSVSVPASHPWRVPFIGREPSYRRMSGLELENPLNFTDEVLRRGERLYAENCDFCHGSDGRGDGPVAPKLFPRPRDLTSPRVQTKAEGEMFLVITRGEGGMPPFRTDLTMKERWSLVHYLRRTLAGKAD